VARATRNIDNMSKTVETMTRTARDSTWIVTDYVVQAQEVNTRFAQRAFETWIEASRRQTELGQFMAQRLFGKAEEQTDAFRSLYGQWVGMPWSFPFSGFPFSGTSYAPRSFQRQGMRLVETATETAAGSIEAIPGGNGSFPIGKYDELSVEEISGELGTLSTEELAMVLGYEKSNKNRETLLYEIERKMSFPIEGYDEMNVGEISGRLDGLSEEELKKVRDYEKRNKSRDTLIEQLDRKIKAHS
jgi:hypothetical protein